ncbi:hypothetical protein SAMN05444858_11694 [Micromonospora avicenniae]|uniref:Uncharacterized protein n=1 Tax=Micromonospora avicenniae TaxID=1198245 RepID=A0A1N7DFN3_9ACTN|nr:hypothetical protein SAMN05444858_11694 [Micromonospora avicenniae]
MTTRRPGGNGSIRGQHPNVDIRYSDRVRSTLPLVGRPARRYYQLIAEGATGARQALAELRALNPRPVRGDAEPTGAPAW